VRFREGRLGESLGLLTPLVKANTTEARAYWGLGRIYWASSVYQHAKLQFDLANQRDPDDPDIHKRWLFTLTRKERIAALKGYLKEGADEDSDEREHLETSLVAMAEAEEKNRKGCRLVGGVHESHQEMERLLYGAQRIRGYGLKVEINGAKGKLLLDSGASGILINRKMAQKAGVEAVAKTDFHGIGDKGSVAGYIGTANSIKSAISNFRDASSRLRIETQWRRKTDLLVPMSSVLFWWILTSRTTNFISLLCLPCRLLPTRKRRSSPNIPASPVSVTGSFPKSSRISPQSIASITCC